MKAGRMLKAKGQSAGFYSGGSFDCSGHFSFDHCSVAQSVCVLISGDPEGKEGQQPDPGGGEPL